MVERKEGGAIVNISSVGGYKAVPNHTIYCSAKGAMDQLTRTMALELGPHKVGFLSKLSISALIVITCPHRLLLCYRCHGAATEAKGTIRWVGYHERPAHLSFNLRHSDGHYKSLPERKQCSKHLLSLCEETVCRNDSIFIHVSLLDYSQ